MSKKWIYILGGLLAFSIYFLFQFDAELRRRINVQSERIARLEAKVSAYIRHEEKQGAQESISRITTSTDTLREEFHTYQKRTTQLLELLIDKDEAFDKKLKRLKSTKDELAPVSKEAKSVPDGFEELK